MATPDEQSSLTACHVHWFNTTSEIRPSLYNGQNFVVATTGGLYSTGPLTSSTSSSRTCLGSISLTRSCSLCWLNTLVWSVRGSPCSVTQYST